MLLRTPSTRSTPVSARLEQRVETAAFFDALMNLQARVAGDVIEIAEHTWAIHAVIPVDGDVIIGEFDSPQAGREVLEQLAVVGLPNA
jgi:hypothetical protein